MHQFVGDAESDHWGFRSWNDFFTRRFRPGLRPIARSDDNKVIISVCESPPYAIKTDVKRQDPCWIKAQPYSLGDRLAHDEAVDVLVVGTVYQAFLDAHSDHHWSASSPTEWSRVSVRRSTA